jgi:predicted Zn-dependent protease
MNNRLRLTFLIALLCTGITFTVSLVIKQIGTPLPPSLAPLLGLVGKPVQSVDHLVTRIINVSDIDERELGEVLHARYAAKYTNAKYASDIQYLNELIQRLSARAQKPFKYRVYLLPYDQPNAIALPGGVILITRGMLQVINSEAELVSVLAHEQGHIELGHCLDAVKFQLLAEKVDNKTLGAIADYAVYILVSHYFSKTQEDDADEYAYTALLYSPYDPCGVGQAFNSLLQWQQQYTKQPAQRHDINPLRDLLISHPPLELRIAKYQQRAEVWWRLHLNEERHLGVENLRDRIIVQSP